MQSHVVLSTFAGFGIMYFLFVNGVKMDVGNMVRPGRKAAIIGLSSFFVTMGSSVGLAFILKKCLPMSSSLDKSLLLIASSQSLTGFPVIVTLLSELKILNTDVGRLALSVSMFCDLIGISIIATMFSINQSKPGDPFGFLPPFLSVVIFVAAIFMIVRPRLVKKYKHTMDTKAVDEKTIVFIFILVMVCGFVTDAIGQHFILGPLVLGLAVPDGPPLGAAISSKLDTLATAFLYPAFCAISGAKTNLLTIDLQSLLVTAILIFISSLVKLLAVMLSAMGMGLHFMEALVLGLILNAKGIVELTIYNLWFDDKLIEEKEFALVMLAVIVITAIVTPLIKRLYDPSKQYLSAKRSTVYQARRDSEFRVMVCIHNNENVPTIVNLLEASHATRETPVAVTAMVLVELVGRSTPALISNQSGKHLQSKNSSVGTSVFKALSLYEEQNQGCASVQSYTSISHFQTMHDDVCRVAYEKLSHIVIVPFHKQWAIDGSIESVSRPIQNLNLNVLDKAPCSVGILVDRGNLTGFASVRTPTTQFQVAVLFIGGPDDVDALAYGCRMAKHECVHLTVVHFLMFGDENSKDRKNDSHLINEFRQENIGNNRFLYVEEVLRDGEGLTSYITGMAEYYHLMLVGRDHSDSPLLEGLGAWSECPELGIIGDILSAPDFKTKASVLVIQQQRIGGKMNNLPCVVRNRNAMVAPEEFHRPPLIVDPSNYSFSVSMPLYDDPYK
ncbi:Cation/H+ exchanger [Corchorus olitorius]|uniref:Cation/H+ exchanger n=1 Tax=Corchorus olitorius TaxID=93759 RepID=A0A1R3HZT6_9ROSI|nr:Cation/H+ exchanger [Corchorus olitorius]